MTYDTGIVFSGPGYDIPTRPKLDPAIAERELQIVRDDLHCNAVRLIGRDVDTLMQVAERALALGLEVWLSPALWGLPPDETLNYDVSAAERAEELRAQHPERFVLVLGSELTIFMQGIVPGKDFAARSREAFTRMKAGDHSANDRLNDFLGRASTAVRGKYHGLLSYASLIWEDVNWDRFDLIGVDHYRDARIKDRYVQMLQPLLELGKPVINTEFGMRTYRGADSDGTLGFGVADQTRVGLHHLPVVGRFIRERLKGDYVRDEAMQARELTETLTALDAAGVEGAFVAEFVTAAAMFSDKPRYDLDMNAFALVKTYRHGKGTTYPDMNWEPKQSFHAIADYYADQEQLTPR
ncbi:MAG: abortive infection protein [Actinobacteria bacterium]|nr:abortive infection protein [Actinomycetota bacterium]